MRSISVALVLALALSTDAITQEPLPGQRVRITAPSLSLARHEGTFLRIQRDTLVLESMSIPLSDMTQFEVFVRHGNPWRGAKIGFVAGFTPMFLAAHAYSWGGCIDGTCFSDTGIGLIMGTTFGAFGALAGAMIGGLTDKWKEVPLDQLQVSVAPTRNSFGIGVRVSF